MKEFPSSEKKKCRKWVIKRLKSRGCFYIDSKAVGNLSNATLFSKYEAVFGSNHKSDFLLLKERKQQYSDVGFVYVIGNLAAKVCKIGFSKTPYNRLKSIQTGCPYPLEILLTFEGNRRIEKLLQKKYFDYRTSGEWFSIEGMLKESIYNKLSA